jgi:translation initiation factor IF-1
MKAGQQMTETSKIKKTVFILSLAVVALTLTGCWTPPNADVQPKGEPRLIQSGVSVERSDIRATVQTIGASRSVFNLILSDGTPVICTVSPQVKNLDQIHAGDQVKVTLAEKLAVYVLKDGRLTGADSTGEVVPFIARVQMVDPSYRLLMLQYLNGQTEVLKADLDAKLMEMQPGDAVVLQSAEAVAIHVEKK